MPILGGYTIAAADKCYDRLTFETMNLMGID